MNLDCIHLQLHTLRMFKKLTNFVMQTVGTSNLQELENHKAQHGIVGTTVLKQEY